MSDLPFSVWWRPSMYRIPLLKMRTADLNAALALRDHLNRVRPDGAEGEAYVSAQRGPEYGEETIP